MAKQHPIVGGPLDGRTASIDDLKGDQKIVDRYDRAKGEWIYKRELRQGGRYREYAKDYLMVNRSGVNRSASEAYDKAPKSWFIHISLIPGPTYGQILNESIEQAKKIPREYRLPFPGEE